MRFVLSSQMSFFTVDPFCEKERILTDKNLRFSNSLVARKRRWRGWKERVEGRHRGPRVPVLGAPLGPPSPSP